MRVLTPDVNKKFEELKDSVFLAGPCPRNKTDKDWRDEAIELFKKYSFEGDIINPTNRNYDDDLERQTKWETAGIHYASVVLFWIPRSEKHPGLTTNIEFGEWFDIGLHRRGNYLTLTSTAVKLKHGEPIQVLLTPVYLRGHWKVTALAI